MARVHADIAALRDLSQSFSQFRFDQKAVLDGARHEIDATFASLEQKLYRWQAELEARESALRYCYERAAMEEPDAYPCDCGREQMAVDEAMERLSNIRAWFSRVEEATQAYLGPRERLSRLIDSGVPAATSYLRDVVEALEAVRRTQLSDG